jgi:hypothetical protein
MGREKHLGEKFAELLVGELGFEVLAAMVFM